MGRTVDTGMHPIGMSHSICVQTPSTMTHWHSIQPLVITAISTKSMFRVSGHSALSPLRDRLLFYYHSSLAGVRAEEIRCVQHGMAVNRLTQTVQELRAMAVRATSLSPPRLPFGAGGAASPAKSLGHEAPVTLSVGRR